MKFDPEAFDSLSDEEKRERVKTLSKAEKKAWTDFAWAKFTASVRYKPELWDNGKSENDLRVEKDSQVFEVISQGAKSRVVGFHRISAMQLGYFESSRWIPYKDKSLNLKLTKSLEDSKTCESGGEANPYLRFHLMDRTIVSIARIR